MYYKILKSISICTLFLSVKICSAFSYEIEPHLINDNLRLAAIGNLDLVVEDFNNEINAYDFGKSPAGVIDDDNGASFIYVPGIYGFTALGDGILGGTDWHGYGFSVAGILKLKSKFAIGGSFSKTSANEEVDSWMLRRSEYYANYYDTLVIGYKFLPAFSFGFRGSYTKNTVREEDYYGSNYGELRIYSYEPSVLVSPCKTHWKFGFNYRLWKYDSYWTTHSFAIPVLFSSQNLKFGLKSYLETQPNDSPNKSLEFRSIYRIFMNRRQINFGLMLKGASYYISEQYYFIYADEWAMSIGTGVAYIDRNIGLLGFQYKLNIIKEYQNQSAIHQRDLNLGAEFYLFQNIPIRVGYTKIGYTNGSDYPSYDIITSGFGIKIPGVKLEIDFAHNLKFLRYYSYKDHIFGLSGRLVFP